MDMDMDMDFDEPELAPPVHTPAPVHTPSPEPTAVAGKPSTKAPSDADLDAFEGSQAKQGSAAGTVLKLLLLLILLIAAGLMVWSLITTQNPNPLPMLQDLLSGGAAQAGDGADTAEAKAAEADEPDDKSDG